jgi:hypothetical protein
MRKVYVTLEVTVCLQVEGNVDVREAVDNLEVSVRPCDEYLDDVDVLDASVNESVITDVK